ncbi:MAG: cellulase family glycosylhydrolase [Streptococcus sp.]
MKLWEAIAARYNGNEWVAGYDLLNEPGGALGTEQFEVYDRIYKAVRAIDRIVSFKFKQFGNQRTYQLQHYMAGKMLFINIISMDG